jgi:hypothetical protein
MDATYADAARMLRDALDEAKVSDIGSGAVLEVLSVLGQPSQLAELAKCVSADPDATAACAARSYRHPLGFDKIMLVECNPIFTLRLHVWWPASVPSVDHVHNHRFDFMSLVVQGGYEMEVFEVGNTGNPVAEYREELHDEEGSRLQHIGKANLRPLTTVRLKQGASYALNAEALHRVSVRPGTFCMTLFLQTAPWKSATRVFADPSERILATNPKKVLSPESYRRELKAVISELSRRSGVLALSP